MASPVCTSKNCMPSLSTAAYLDLRIELALGQLEPFLTRRSLPLRAWLPGQELHGPAVAHDQDQRGAAPDDPVPDGAELGVGDSHWRRHHEAAPGAFLGEEPHALSAKDTSTAAKPTAIARRHARQ